MDDTRAQELIDVLRALTDKVDNIDRNIENVWRGIDNLTENLPAK